ARRGRGAHLEARPRLVLGRGDLHGPRSLGTGEGARIDAEALEQILGHQAEVQGLGHLAREMVDLLDGGQPETARLLVHQPCSPARARARASSSGVLTFMKICAGSPKGARSASAISSTRTSSKKPVILSRPAAILRSMGPRQARA